MLLEALNISWIYTFEAKPGLAFLILGALQCVNS